MVHRGEPAAKHRVEGISVFVRVRPAGGAQEGHISQVRHNEKYKKKTGRTKRYIRSDPE